MMRWLLLAAFLMNSPLARCGLLTYDFEVEVRENGIRFVGMFTAVEDTWNDAILSSHEVIDLSVTVSDGNCCAYDFVDPYYNPRARFPSFTLATEALTRGSFNIYPRFSNFHLALRQFLSDGSELRTSVHVNPNQQGGTSTQVAYWDPGGVYNSDNVFHDSILDANPFSGSPPFAFNLALRPAEVPIPATLTLMALSLGCLGGLRACMST